MFVRQVVPLKNEAWRYILIPLEETCIRQVSCLTLRLLDRMLKLDL